MATAGKNGISSTTPENILFGAGTIHKNLEYTAPTYSLTSDVAIDATKSYYTRSGSAGSYVYTAVASPVLSNIGTYYEMTAGGWNFAASIMGATNGGSKVSIVPEFVDIPLDGALVAVKGLKVKTGESAIMEVNFAELTKEIIKSAVIGAYGTSEDAANYDLIKSKSGVEAGDYFDNIAFFGKTLDGDDIMVILENALCTSGFDSEAKNKEGAVGKYTFTCHADIADGTDLDTLPWKIQISKA